METSPLHMAKTLEEVRDSLAARPRPDKAKRQLTDAGNRSIALISATADMGKKLQELSKSLDGPESVQRLRQLQEINDALENMGSEFARHCRELFSGLMSHQTDRMATEELKKD